MIDLNHGRRPSPWQHSPSAGRLLSAALLLGCPITPGPSAPVSAAQPSNDVLSPKKHSPITGWLLSAAMMPKYPITIYSLASALCSTACSRQLTLNAG